MAKKRVTQGRMEPIRRPVRIGFLVPPGNPTVEVEMIALAPPNVSVHFTRMVAHGAVGAHDGLLERTRTQIAHVAENAALLAMVRPKVIAMAHTAMSATLGAAGEADLVARMEREHGIPFITAFGSVLAALARLGATRVALGTPYDAGATARTRAYLEAQGIEVVSEGRLEGVTNIYDETAARARARAPGGRARGAGGVPQRAGHADRRDARGHGARPRQARGLGGSGDDVERAARRRRARAARRLRPAARRAPLSPARLLRIVRAGFEV